MKYKKLIALLVICLIAIPSIYVLSNNHRSEAQSNEPQEPQEPQEQQEQIEGIRNATEAPSFPPTIAHEEFYAENMGMLSLSDIYPPNDELTELMVGDPLTPYYSIEVPAWGYWYDNWFSLESKVFINNQNQMEGELCVGTQVNYQSIPTLPHYLIFTFSSVMDASQWQEFHYYQALDYWASACMHASVGYNKGNIYVF